MKPKFIPYKPYLKDLAGKNRNSGTLAEIELWKQLKGKQMCGYDFHRQKPLLDYIVDFYCPKLKLVLELDGYSHHFEHIVEKDEIKQRDLEEWGLKILRFSDDEVLKQMPNVLMEIEGYISEFEKSS